MNMLITTIPKLQQVKFFLISFVVPVQALNTRMFRSLTFQALS